MSLPNEGSKAKAKGGNVARGQKGRAMPIEEDGINASTGCCFAVSEAERQFLDAESAETGSVHIMHFLRAGIT